MVAYGSMSRAELIETVRSLETRLANISTSGRSPPGDSVMFPIFGEREQREFEASPWPIRIFDRETLKYLAANDACLKLYGYTREEFLNLTPLDTRHPEGRSDFYDTLPEPTGYLRHWGPRQHVTKSGDIIVVEIVTQDILYEGREARLSLTLDVTERMRMQERLRQREREFSALVEHAPDIIARFDRELRYIYVNPAVSAAMDIPRQAFIGKASREVGVPQSLEALWEREIGRVFETGQEHRVEFECPCHGEIRSFETRMVPEFGPDGATETVIAIARDVTERRRAEGELKRQKKLLDAVIDNLPVGITVKDAYTLRYLLRNRMADEVTGLSDAETIGKRADEVYPPELAELIRASDREALASGGAVTISPLVVRQCPGRVVRNLKVPVPDEAGRYTHLVSILEDLTDIEQAQAALRRSEQRLNQLISMSPAAIFSFSLDPPFGTTFVSENVTAQVGWQPSDFTGSPTFWLEHVHPDDRARAEDAVSRIAADGKYQCEYRFRHKDGNWRWMRDEGQSVRDGNGRPHEAIGIWMDITANRQEAEERLASALRQRDALVREVHHRIKNHLQGIAGLIRQKANGNPAVAALVETAVAQLHSIAMIYGIQSEAAAFGVSLPRVLAAICASVESLSGGRIERAFATDGARALRLAETEAVPVAVALNELVLNALKHHVMDDGEASVEVALVEQAECAEIRIVNRGKLPAGFDYVRDRGTGTGLDLVRTLLASKGSTLSFHQRGDKVETLLKLSVPVVAAAPAVPLERVA